MVRYQLAHIGMMKTTRFHKTAYLGPDEAFHFARKQLAKRFPEYAHDHDFYEVFLIEKGRTSHWVNGVTQTLEAGQLVFMRPSDFHAFCADRKVGCQIINVIFRTETVAHLRDRYSDTIAGRFFDYGGQLPELHTLGPARFSRAVSVAEQLQTAARTLAHIEEFLLTSALEELKKSETTILLVEQNFGMAKRLGDTVAVMDDGKVIHHGQMAELAEDEALQEKLMGLSMEAHQ